MSRERILNEFAVLNCIKNYEYLEKYVDFCIERNMQTKFNSSAHHILPRAKTLPFRKFQNLKETIWNQSELSYYDHYRAHYLLTKAIDHYAVYHAFCAMHRKDVELSRLQESDLLSESDINEVNQLRNQQSSRFNREFVEIDGEWISRSSAQMRKFPRSAESRKKTSERMRGENNIVHLPGVVEKIRKTKMETYIDGIPMDTISAIRAAETMKTPIILENGEFSTQYAENGKKLSNTLKTIIQVGDKRMSLAKARGLIHSKNLQEKGKWFLLKNVFDPTFEQKMSDAEIRKFSANLSSKSKDNYCGMSKFAQTTLKKNGKDNLIGLYVEMLP